MEQFTGLGRAEGETFEQYKERRAAMNKAVKRINIRARSGGVSSRTQLRQHQKGGGSYGKDILRSFDQRRDDLAERQHKHKLYLVAKMEKASARLKKNMAEIDAFLNAKATPLQPRTKAA